MLAAGKRFFTGNIRPEALARLTLPINVLLIVLLAQDLARLSWILLPLPSISPVTIGESHHSPTSAANTNTPETDYGVIADWHLFGRIQAAKPEPPPVITAPETKLNLRLVGTFYTQNGGKARALIAEGSGEVRSYPVGAELPGGARLEQILRDRVVLSRNGQLETLSLPQETGGVETTPEIGLATPPVNGAETANPGVTIDASAIAARFRESITTEPEALQDLALVDPYIQNGQFMGFRLRPGRDRRLLQQLGLRSGDVITEVNGTPLNDPATGFALLQDALSADRVTIQVLRNGAEIPFTFYTHAR